MTKLPFMQFFPNDWLTDTSLRMLPLDSKGFWIDLICYLWKSKERGKITGTYEQIARVMGLDIQTVKFHIKMLDVTDTATVTESNGIVTIESRRIIKEESKRSGGAKRTARHREKKSNADVTDGNKDISDIINHTSDKIPVQARNLALLFSDLRLLEKDVPDKDIEKWAGEIYKLVRLDKETYEDIEKVIYWVTSDDFWKNQCHSLMKLRRKDKEDVKYFDKFKLMSRGKNGRNQITGNTEYKPTL